MIEHGVPMPAPGPHKGFKARLAELEMASHGASLELHISREQLRNAMKNFGGPTRSLSYRQVADGVFRIWKI